MAQYFYKKLSNRLDDTAILESFNALLSVATSPGSFISSDEFKKYITEGALLNVNTIGSRALSIPCGEYQVWLTDAGHTMLVPTSDNAFNNDVYENREIGFEISTRDMLKTYNGFSKTLAENFYGNAGMGEAEDDYMAMSERDTEEGASPDNDPGEFELTVQKQTVDRKPLLRAMEEKELTVTELAALCSVDPPAISRILREPETGPGDPGGRNPSMDLAARICAALSIDPKTAFPDIFNKKSYSTKNED